MKDISSTTRLSDCSILLLAGGRGQRMGGRDKGWIHWQSRALIEHMHQVVRPLTDDLIISCNRNYERYRILADQLISDPAADYPGPLVGIIEAMKVAGNSQLLVLPCDAPRIDQALLHSLHRQAGKRPVMLHQQDHWQPLFSLLPVNLLSALQEQWQAGQRSPLRALLKLQPVAVHIAADDRRLDNFNEPARLIETL